MATDKEKTPEEILKLEIKHELHRLTGVDVLMGEDLFCTRIITLATEYAEQQARKAFEAARQGKCLVDSEILSDIFQDVNPKYPTYDDYLTSNP